MEYPTTQDDFVRELEFFLHSRVLYVDEQAFFSDFIQGDFRQWLNICDEEAFGQFFGNLQNFLINGAQLSTIEEYHNLIVRVLSGTVIHHQMRPLSDRQDTTEAESRYEALMHKASATLEQSGDINAAVSKTDVFEFLQETENKYLIATLLMCVLNPQYLSSYRHIVYGKVTRFTYGFGFWEALSGPLDDDCSVSHLLWLDMLSDSVGTLMSSARFAEMVKAAG